MSKQTKMAVEDYVRWCTCMDALPAQELQAMRQDVHELTWLIGRKAFFSSSVMAP